MDGVGAGVLGGTVKEVVTACELYGLDIQTSDRRPRSSANLRRELVLLGCEKGREEGSRVGHAGGFEDAMVAGVARCSELRADDQGQDSS